MLCAWSKSCPKLAKAVTVWRKVKILEVAIVEMPAINLARRKGSALLCLSIYEGYSADVMYVCSYCWVCNIFCMISCCFKQKTAYEIMPSLVGSEMCIRDRIWAVLYVGLWRQKSVSFAGCFHKSRGVCHMCCVRGLKVARNWQKL